MSTTYLYLINKTKTVQERFTKRLNDFSALSYYGQLIRLGTGSLVARRLKLDLVLFYDIIHNNIDVDVPLLDIMGPNVIHSCGHSLKIMKQRSKINAFACRNVNAWNSLPENVAHCKSTATYKRFINGTDFSKFLPG